MGTATKSAFSKTKATFAGFVGKKSNVDENGNPISLDDPTSIGYTSKRRPRSLCRQVNYGRHGDFTKAMESYTKAFGIGTQERECTGQHC